MYKSSDRKPPRAISGRDNRCDKKSRDTKGPRINGKCAVTSRTSLLCTSVFSCPGGRQATYPFGLEGKVISLNMRANAGGNTLDLASVLLQNSGRKASNEGIAGEYNKDPTHFEQWCREQGLLIEVDDTDYAEPKLAIAN